MPSKMDLNDYMDPGKRLRDEHYDQMMSEAHEALNKVENSNDWMDEMFTKSKFKINEYVRVNFHNLICDYDDRYSFDNISRNHGYIGKITAIDDSGTKYHLDGLSELCYESTLESATEKELSDYFNPYVINNNAYYILEDPNIFEFHRALNLMIEKNPEYKIVTAAEHKLELYDLNHNGSNRAVFMRKDLIDNTIVGSGSFDEV